MTSRLGMVSEYIFLKIIIITNFEINHLHLHFTYLQLNVTNLSETFMYDLILSCPKYNKNGTPTVILRFTFLYRFQKFNPIMYCIEFIVNQIDPRGSEVTSVVVNLQIYYFQHLMVK